ncbi:MAG: hypothetical protein LBH04_10325 [Tannerellaceae bacterium]|nr:hypothetical protein [Tannerellaceae bacterium]
MAETKRRTLEFYIFKKLRTSIETCGEPRVTFRESPLILGESTETLRESTVILGESRETL